MTDNAETEIDVEMKKKTKSKKKDTKEDKSKNNISDKSDTANDDDPLKNLESKLQEAEEEAKDKHDRLLRVSAEFENYKKRTSREMDEFRKFANESLVKDMLFVVDNLERAIHSAKEEKSANSSVIEGIDIIVKEIMKLFEKYGVMPIDAMNKLFDPAYHQAVAQEEMSDIPVNTVLKELQKGYMIHDRLLRPAMVIVSVAKEKGKNNKPDE